MMRALQLAPRITHTADGKPRVKTRTRPRTAGLLTQLSRPLAAHVIIHTETQQVVGLKKIPLDFRCIGATRGKGECIS